MICEGCEANEHWRCGMQTWCECPCDGSIDYGAWEPDPYKGQLVDRDED